MEQITKFGLKLINTRLTTKRQAGKWAKRETAMKILLVPLGAYVQ